jgi:hypothetical protein
MILVAWSLSRWQQKAPRGHLFLALIAAYLAFRLVVDFWKPGITVALGLTAIQFACLAGLAMTFRVWRYRRASPFMSGTG